MKRRLLSLLVLVLLAGLQSANSQTIYDWQTSAPDGNFRQGAAGVRWNPGSLQDEPTGSDVVLHFNNNTQPTLTNNVSGYTIHGLLFGPSSSSRTLGGSSLAFVTFGGANPYISNTTSGVSHIITLPITGDGTVPLEIRPTSGNMTLNGSIDNMGAPLWINTGSGRTVAIGGSISGAGALDLRSANTVVLTATNTYGGATIIANSGTLQFSSDAQLGNGTDVRINGGTLSLTAGTVNTNRNFILGPSTGIGTGTIAVASTLTVNGIVSNDGSGTGAFTKTGVGTLLLQNTSNAYSGNTTVSQGVFTVLSDACMGTSPNVFIGNGATFRITSGADVTTRNFYIGPATGVGSASINVSATSYELTGLLANNGTSTSSLFKTGSGVLILSGAAKTFGGGGTPTITINGGGMRNMANNMVATSMNLTVANTAGVFYDLNGFNQQFASLAGGGATGGNILLGGGTLTVNSQLATTFSGTISGSGQFSKSGTLTLTLSGNNQSETWSPTISAGTVVFNTAAAYPQHQNLRINNNAVFGIGISNAAKFNIGDLTISSGGTIDLGTGTSAFDVEFANSGPTFSGTLTIRNWTYFGNKRILFTNTAHIATVLANITFEGYGPGAVFKGATNEIIPATIYFTLNPVVPTSGNFSDPASWQGGVVPPVNSNILVMSNFSLNFDITSYSLRSIDVASGASFICNSNNQLTLGSAVAGFSKLSNYGTTLFSAGEFFVDVSGSYIDGNNSSILNNITTSGPLQFRRAPTINGTFQLNSNSAVSGTAPFYGTASTLVYNTGGIYYRNVEWNSITGAGYPRDIYVTNNTEIQIQIFPHSNLGCSRDLVIEAGSHLNFNLGWVQSYIGRDLIINGRLTFSGGLSPDADLRLYRNWYRSATGTVNFGASRRVYMIGSTSATITGPPGQLESIIWLDMQKSGGAVVTLNSPLRVYGILSLNTGRIISSTSNYMLVDHATLVAGGNINSFVIGPLKKRGRNNNVTTPFTFHIGKVVGSQIHYRPLTISPPANSTDEYTAEFHRDNPYLQGPISAAARAKGLQAISFCEYWDLTKTATSPAVTVTIGWSTNALGRSQCNANAYVNQAYASSLVVVPFYNGEWGDNPSPIPADPGDKLFGYDAHTNPASSLWLGTVRWNGQIDSYQKFVLGTTDVLMNPLPETQFQLKGNLKANTAYLNWTMRSNLLYQNYLVQYSADGVQFRDIKELTAYATAGSASYQYLHTGPSAGWNFYRVVAVNTEGQRFVSNTIRLWAGNAMGSPVVFPNPVSNNRIQLFTTGLEKGRYLSQLTGMDGRVWMQRELFFAGNGQVETIALDPKIPSGVYWLSLSREGMDPVRIKLVK